MWLVYFDPYYTENLKWLVVHATWISLRQKTLKSVMPNFVRSRPATENPTQGNLQCGVVQKIMYVLIQIPVKYKINIFKSLYFQWRWLKVMT